MTIDEFIKIVAPRLRGKVTKVMEEMWGRDLKLTGYKEVDGKPIEDHKKYRIPVPVAEKIDHKRLMSLAWLRGGKLAIASYLRKYMKAEEVTEVMKVLK